MNKFKFLMAVCLVYFIVIIFIVCFLFFSFWNALMCAIPITIMLLFSYEIAFAKEEAISDPITERLWAIIGEHSEFFNEPNSCGDPDFEQVIGDLTDLFIRKLDHVFVPSGNNGDYEKLKVMAILDSNLNHKKSDEVK